MKVHEALAAVMADVRAVGKGEKHGQGWSFRGVDAVVNAVAPACRKHGVVVLPEVLDHRAEVLASSGGKQMRSVTVNVLYRMVGPEGDSLTVTSVGEAMDHGDKATAKAMSVAWRTALIQAFMLPTDEPDPDHDVYEVAAPPTFDPNDADTWPESLFESQAKQVVLLAAGGDKEKARELWVEVGEWRGWPREDMEHVLAGGLG